METQLLRSDGHVRARQIAQSQSSFVTCSVCLRVLRGAAWAEAGELIRSLRTFERAAVPRLQAGLCEHCQQELRLRRQKSEERLAA
jgi:hypothetical protein